MWLIIVDVNDGDDAANDTVPEDSRTETTCSSIAASKLRYTRRADRDAGASLPSDAPHRSRSGLAYNNLELGSAPCPSGCEGFVPV